MKVFTGTVAALLLSASVASSQSSVSAAPSLIHFPYTPVGSSHDTSVTINIYVPYVNGDDQCYIEIKSPVGFTFKTPCFTTFVSDGQNCPGWGGGDGHFSVQITVRYTPTSSSGQGGTITLDVYRGSQYLNPPVEVQSTIVMSGDPLPIQLASFKAGRLVSSNGVQLTWITLSEVNNYGFNVQRSSSKVTGYVDISGLIPGKGTTIERHDYSWTDRGAAGGYYRLNQIDLDGTSHLSEIIEFSSPSAYKLEQNFPNPFNPTTQVAYSLKSDGMTTLDVYNVLGQKVLTAVSEFQTAGSYRVMVDCSRLSSGTFIYVLRNGDFKAAKSMTLLR
jgi:hypothetical protein